MRSSQEIVERFLETNLQVHPDVVAYIKEQGNPGVIEGMAYLVIV